jgi:hypothetical protein
MLKGSTGKRLTYRRAGEVACAQQKARRLAAMRRANRPPESA